MRMIIGSPGGLQTLDTNPTWLQINLNIK